MDEEYKGRWWELYAGPTDIETDELSEYQQGLLNGIDFFGVLTEKQLLVIKYIYFDGLTEKETAAKLGNSQQAVHFLKRKALKKLKKSTGGC